VIDLAEVTIESFSSNFSLFTFVIAPLATEMRTSNGHDESLFTSESHVHHTCQWPPAVYSVKTPTPWPGAASIVWFVSTSTRMGVVFVGSLSLPPVGPPLATSVTGPRPWAGSVWTTHAMANDAVNASA